MKNWYEKSINALQLSGKGASTQKCYTRQVQLLIQHTQKPPHRITEKDLEAYFLYRKNECKWASSTMQICFYGLRFFLKTF